MNFYFEKSLLGWMIKNNASIYVYANDLACSYLDLPAEKIIGHSDMELFYGASEHYKYILNDDKKVMHSKKMSIVLKIFNHGPGDKTRAYLVEKRPWILTDGSPGIICTYIELTTIYLSSFFCQTYRTPLVFTKPSTLFTDREWEIILLLLCGVKRGGISEILGISRITLRNRINICCEKVGVLNTPPLLAFIRRNRWDNYIPPFFIKEGHVLLV